MFFVVVYLCACVRACVRACVCVCVCVFKLGYYLSYGTGTSEFGHYARECEFGILKKKEKKKKAIS